MNIFVKDFLNLARSFEHLVKWSPSCLVIVAKLGDCRAHVMFVVYLHDHDSDFYHLPISIVKQKRYDLASMHVIPRTKNPEVWCNQE